MDDIERFIALSTKGDGALRTGHLWIRAHDSHTQIRMVPAELGAARWRELMHEIAAGALKRGTRAAVQLLALTNNAHAFRDGNGRLGRALFNYCLHCSGLPDTCFVPLKTLAALSHGGYELYLREAELFGRWDGLYAYHCTAIDIYRWVGHQPATLELIGDV